LTPSWVAKRCLVAGRVQGVYFRASSRDEARRLNLRGFARNLPDGRVEVLVAGPEPAVNEFISWLWRGPAMARVDAVESHAATVAEAPDPFTVA